METTNSIKESEFSLKYFKIAYLTSLTIILIFDIIIIVLLFTIWANLEVVIYVLKEGFNPPNFPLGLLLYYLFLLSPLGKVGFEIYELVRFTRFLKSTSQDKENAINLAKGFKGTRIYRIYYLVIMAALIVWLEIFDFISKHVSVSSGYLIYSKFYWWFAILLFIHILPIIVGPEIIKFAIEYTNKKERIKIILDIILWTIILILVLNIDLFIALFALIIF